MKSYGLRSNVPGFHSDLVIHKPRGSLHSSQASLSYWLRISVLSTSKKRSSASYQQKKGRVHIHPNTTIRSLKIEKFANEFQPSASSILGFTTVVVYRSRLDRYLIYQVLGKSGLKLRLQCHEAFYPFQWHKQLLILEDNSKSITQLIINSLFA